MSISTTSDRPPHGLDRLAPVGGQRDDIEPASGQHHLGPERTRSWSSATTTLIAAVMAATGRLAVSSNRPSRTPWLSCPPRRATRSAIPTRPRPAPDPPRPLLGLVASIDRASVVAARRSRAVWSAAVPQRVGQCFLHDPVRRHVDARGQPRQRLGHLEIDGESARPERRHQPARSASPGAGSRPSRRRRHAARAAAGPSRRSRDGRCRRHRRARVRHGRGPGRTRSCAAPSGRPWR